MRLLQPPLIESVKPCVDGDGRALAEFCAHRESLERAQTLVTIEGAIVRDVVGFVELPDGQICYEGNWWLPYLTDHPAYKRRLTLKRRTLAGNIYSLLSLWPAEYYHWFHDALPRLEAAWPYLPADTRFLINPDPKKWQLDSLAAFGIGPDRLEVQPSCIHTSVGSLWFATPAGTENIGSGTLLRKVARRLSRHFGVRDSGGQKRNYYVSRRNAKCRRVVNETEMEPALKEASFTTLLCEEMTLREQVEVFSHAGTIIGPHGAGLTNVIYSQEGCFLGEIGLEGFTVHFLVMARQLGMRFAQFRADAVRLPGEWGNAFDLRVNTNSFSRWLLELG